MSAVPIDRRHEALGKYMKSEHGPVYVRDAMSDELIREIAELYISGDLAAVGDVLGRAMRKDEHIAAAIARRNEAELEQIRRDQVDWCPLEDMFPPRHQFLNYEPETGIAYQGEI